MKDQLQNCVASICALTGGGDYTGAPEPQNETNRLNTLKDLQLLDTVPQRSYDKATNLICQLFNIPICLISLVDVNRQWFKSVQGLPGVTETSRDVSFCAWTLLPPNAELLVVDDASKDPRFKDNGLVTGEPHIRFYGGCPLIASNGHRLGTVCAIGREPRTFVRQEAYLLSNITEIAIREIERKAASDSSKDPNHFLLQKGTRKLLRSDSCYQAGFCLMDFKKPQDWQIIFMSEQAENILQRQVDENLPFWELFKSCKVDGEIVSADNGNNKYLKMMQNSEKFRAFLSYRNKTGQKRWVEAVFSPATNSFIDRYMLFVQIPEDLPQGKPEDFCYYWIELQEHEIEEQLDVVTNMLVGVPEAAFGTYDTFVTISLISQGSFPQSMTYRGIHGGETVVKKTFSIPYETYANLKENILQQLPQSDYLTKTSGYLYEEKNKECQIVQEICNEGNLSSAMQQGLFTSRRFPSHPSACVVLLSCLDIIKGLQSLHNARIYHGHLTPNNILLNTEEDDYRGFKIKVSDAGTYSILKNSKQIQSNETDKEFMAPEWESCSSINQYQMSDIYSFGKIVSFMIGNVSFTESANKFQKILSEIQNLAGSCVAERPTQRPSADELLQKLESIFEGANSNGQLLSRQSYEADGPMSFVGQLLVSS